MDNLSILLGALVYVSSISPACNIIPFNCNPVVNKNPIWRSFLIPL